MRSPICSKPGFKLAAASALALLVLPGCPNREVAKVDPGKGIVGGGKFDVNISRNVDILFVIDNSSSMAEEQASLAENFDKFIDVLSSVEGGLPNVHIGVISTDMGAKAPGEPAIPNSAGPRGSGQTCDELGDEGKLQAEPSPLDPGCDTPSDPYIVDVDGTVNYSGSLADTFSCIARLGIEGCVFEQQLEAMRAALDPALNLNPGFIREDAYLGIVFITDEDDCSAHDPHIFNGDQSLNTKDSELGHAVSYRCFEWGVQCEPTVGRDPASYTNCRPREDSPYLWNVQERYVDFLKNEIGKDPSQIILAAITGSPTNGDVEVIDRVRGDLVETDVEVMPSCETGNGAAVPPIRIKYLLDQFPDEQTHLAEICQDDLSQPIQAIAEVFAERVSNFCLPANIADNANGDPDCAVTPIVGGQQQPPLPFCNADASNTPCWRLDTGDNCEELTLIIERGGEPPPLDSSLDVSCVLE